MLAKEVALSAIKNSRVLVRVAYDISSADARFRIENSIDTIKCLIERGNTVIIATHWGRPVKQELELSVAAQIPIIAQVFHKKLLCLETKIHFVDQIKMGIAKANTLCKKGLNPGDVYLLQNVRFDKREQSVKNSIRIQMAQEYASLADYFVDEAFALSHRTHATNADIKQLMPFAYGLSYQKEVEELTTIATSPPQPFVVISGGAKLETKIPALQKLASKADYILVGGLLCFTLLKASGIEIAGSKIEESQLKNAESLMHTFGSKIILPSDFIYGTSDSSSDSSSPAPLDIGPLTIARFQNVIHSARCIFWNGPLGYYEGGYTHGTESVAKSVISNTKSYNAIGGGDIIASTSAEMLIEFDFVSAGGGATLEFLAKK